VEALIDAIIKSYGLIGLVMISPFVAAVYLWKDNLRLNKDLQILAQKYTDAIDAMGQRVVAAQEKRVDDSKGISVQLMAMVGEHSAQAKEQTLALDRVGDMVSMLNAQISGIASQPRAPARRGQG
jgi:uncharacterized protein involved in tolerance to divalent cations